MLISQLYLYTNPEPDVPELPEEPDVPSSPDVPEVPGVELSTHPVPTWYPYIVASSVT